MAQPVQEQAQDRAARLADFGAFVEQVRDGWKVPGVAVAVVAAGRVVFTQSSGLRDVEHGLPVTPRTLFAIGSCTKAFTTMLLSLLVDEGTLDWDTPIKSYLPAFKMHDPFATERITARDLVTHRSGLPRHDLMWYGSSLTRQEIVERLRYLEPNRDFRTTWQYQNLMYLVAGYLAEQVTGQSWEELVAQRLFAPLGMTCSNLSVTQSQESSDFARPYKLDKEVVSEMPFRNIDTVGPAGSINSTLDDMCAWLMLHLSGGLHEGQRLISEAQIRQLHTPQIPMPSDDRFSEIALPGYALGWFVNSYRGHIMVHHGGDIDGFSALVAMLPREGLGCVVLTNLNNNPIPTVLSYGAFDRLLGLEPVPWNERLSTEKGEVETAMEVGKQKSAEKRLPNTQPSHDLAAYAGDYAHPGYGTLTIELRETPSGETQTIGDQPIGDRASTGEPAEAQTPPRQVKDNEPASTGESERQSSRSLSALFNGLSGLVRHYHYDIFEIVPDQMDTPLKLSFATNAQGDIGSLSIGLEPAVADLQFTRIADSAMSDRGFLTPFVGEYEIMGRTLTVSFKGNGLILSIADQPAYELEPYQGTEFHLKGLSGFSIAFQSDETGRVIAVEVTQPNAVFTAIKKVSTST